jgi:nucleoside-diphosphate-sugar epimerase
MKILGTGSAGYNGSHAIMALPQVGQELVVFGILANASGEAMTQAAAGVYGRFSAPRPRFTGERHPLPSHEVLLMGKPAKARAALRWQQTNLQGYD